MDIGQLITDLIAAPFRCLGWIIAGAIAGAVAHSLLKSNAPLLVDIIIGLLGALVGGFVVNLLGWDRPTGGLDGYIISVLIAIVGAVILLAAGRLLTGRRVT